MKKKKNDVTETSTVVNVEGSNQQPSKRPLADLLSELNENNWSSEYMASMDKKERVSVFRHLLDTVKKVRRCEMHSSKHSYQSIKQDIEENITERLKSLISTTEKRNPFKKRHQVMTIFELSNPLLNPMQMQCPICGAITSLGHFNEVLQKNDKVYQYIKLTHLNALSDIAQKAAAFVLLERHSKYKSLSQSCHTTQLMICSKGAVHGLKEASPSQVIVTSIWQTVPKQFSFKEIANCSSQTCEAKGVIRKCKPGEFLKYFGGYLKHINVVVVTSLDPDSIVKDR